MSGTPDHDPIEEMGRILGEATPGVSDEDWERSLMGVDPAAIMLEHRVEELKAEVERLRLELMMSKEAAKRNALAWEHTAAHFQTQAEQLHAEVERLREERASLRRLLDEEHERVFHLRFELDKLRHPAALGGEK